MCIAVAKVKGVSLPSKETLEACFKANSNGAGFAVWRPGNKLVSISKGFMSFDAFWLALTNAKIKPTDAALLHFRIATAGSVSAANCHPFPLSIKADRLRALECKAGIAMVHNGILTTTPKKAKDFSDTQTFIFKMLGSRAISKNLFCKMSVWRLVEQAIGTNKLAFLNKQGEIYLMGDWIKEGELHYSNRTYVPIVPIKPVYSPQRYSRNYRDKRYDYDDEDYDCGGWRGQIGWYANKCPTCGLWYTYTYQEEHAMSGQAWCHTCRKAFPVTEKTKYQGAGMII